MSSTTVDSGCRNGEYTIYRGAVLVGVLWAHICFRAEDTARSSVAKLTRLQSSRNWSSYGVMDVDEETAVDGIDDYDTVASVREVQVYPQEPAHERLLVNSESSKAFFCFNEESSIISSYVRALYYSAVSLKISCEDTALQEHTHELSDHLQIDVLSASNLAIADYIGTSDPYCMIYWQGERVFKTHHVNRNLHPEWNCTFHIPLHDQDIHSCELRLCVYDYDGHETFVNDDFLGQVRLCQNEMPFSKGRLDAVSATLYRYHSHELTNSDDFRTIIWN